MTSRLWMAAITAGVILATSLAGTDAGDCGKFAPPNHLYKDASGKLLLRTSSASADHRPRILAAFATASD